MSRVVSDDRIKSIFCLTNDLRKLFDSSFVFFLFKKANSAGACVVWNTAMNYYRFIWKMWTYTITWAWTRQHSESLKLPPVIFMFYSWHSVIIAIFTKESFNKEPTTKLNFRGYLISWFYPTRKICENLMQEKICFTVHYMHFVTRGIAFGLVYCNAVTSKTDLACALFDLMQPYLWTECILESPWKRAFLSPGKPWNLVFASPGMSWKMSTNPVIPRDSSFA